jgi:2-(1,2-epoxy-1,2-dihydrophenyl)acetyl-CoA isomerase
MSEYQTLSFQLDGPIATIKLNRPDAANSLNLQMGNELLAVANRCASDAAIRAVILTAEGRMFCAGGDVGGFAKAQNPGELLRAITSGLHAAIQRFQRMDAPLIVAVNGMAAGAGMSLALAGDFTLAAESARFTMAYTGIGLSPDGSSTFFLPRLVGPRKAKELMIRNPLLSAADALQLGIVGQVVADTELLSAARALAAELARGPTRAYGAVKRLVAASLGNGLDAQLEMETRAIAELANHTADARAGIAAFVAKQKPVFEGR